LLYVLIVICDDVQVTRVMLVMQTMMLQHLLSQQAVAAPSNFPCCRWLYWTSGLYYG